MANNTDPSASENDGTCSYDSAWVAPGRTMELNKELEETSGLILWDGYLWTHNDDADTKLYGLDIATAEIVKEYQPLDTTRDWCDQ